MFFSITTTAFRLNIRVEGLTSPLGFWNTNAQLIARYRYYHRSY